MTRRRSSRQLAEPSSSSAASTPVLTPAAESEYNFTSSSTAPEDSHTPRIFTAGISSLGSPSAADSGTVNLEIEFGRIQLLAANSDFNFGELGAALDGLAPPGSSQATSRGVETPRSSEHLTPPPPATRRRSSSRTRQPPHDVSSEEPPQDRYHAASFQAAFNDTLNHMEELEIVLRSSTLHLQDGSAVERLYRNARSMANFTCPNKRVIGFVGDSGVGKSSLLNALLDFRSLARSSNSGAACTCIATEYHYHDRDDFIVETEMFSHDDMDSMLQDMLQSFRCYEFHGDEMARDERVENEQRRTLAWNTFQAMFGDRLMNRSQTLTANSEESVLRKLRRWVGEDNVCALGGRRVLASLAECSAHLVKLTSDPTSPNDRAVWPYIKSLRVYSKAHVLSKGLVLADLPGLRDLNSARRNNTERYLLECDDVFAISGIGRATSDEGVKGVIDLAKRARMSNVGIICTKSDDIKPHEAITDWKGERARHVQRLQDKVDSAEDEISSVQEELKDYDDDDLEDEWKEVALRLARRLSQLSHEKELREFDNDDYWAKRDLPRDAALPLLRLSGIIALRKHCISIVSESKYQGALKYMQHDVAALLNDIELWIQAGAPSLDMEQKQEILQAVDDVERRLKRDLLGRSSALRNFAPSSHTKFEELVYGPNTDITRWCQAARNAADEWSGWHHNSYAAFCRKFGDHYTAAVGSRNWNEEALESMVSDLKQPWQTLVRHITSKEQERTALIQRSVTWAVNHFDSKVRCSTDLTITLVDALVSRHSLIEDELEKIRDLLRSTLRALKTDSFSGIRTSLMGQALEPAYRACNSEYGTGSDRRRKSIMNRKISEDELFEGILEETWKRFRTSINESEREVQRVLSLQFDGLKATLDIVRNENAISEGEQDPDFRVRVQEALARSKAIASRVGTLVGATGDA